MIETKTFTELVKNQVLLKELKTQGFSDATMVQTLTIPPALENKDLVVEAKTGSGKTLSFAIPMISQLLETSRVTKPFGLVVSPTRELAMQIASVYSLLVPGLDPVTLIGGISYTKQKKQLQTDCRIVIGTPGRILDAIDQNDLDLSDLKMFVLDEADEMFSIGFIKDVEKILSEIPKKAQGLFVSATISDRVLDLAKKFLQDPLHISATIEDETPPDIKHLYCDVGENLIDKPIALCDLLEAFDPESAIVFCNTKSETELVEEYLRRRGFDARRLNSDLNQTQRNKIMDKIRAKELRYLIATDIAARGIDIAQIELVVNYSIHSQAESYVHRTGRTGRAGRKGTALSLVAPQDFLGFKAVKDLGIPLEKIKQPSEYEVACAQIKHLNESLKHTRTKLTNRDLILGQEILKSIETNKEDLEKLIASLARYTLEHLISLETVSLEDELEKANKANNPSMENNRNYQRNNKRNNKNYNSY